jgi:hypothetical protein
MEYIKKVILSSEDIEKIISSVINKKYPNEKIESINIEYSKKNSEYAYASDGLIEHKEDITTFFEKLFATMVINFKAE